MFFLMSNRKSFMLVIILMVTSFSFADVPDNINSLVVSFLESYNQLEGIELLGGPFELNEYTSQIQTFSTSKHQYIDYKYSENGSTKGWPSSFSVWIHNGINSPLSMSPDSVSISEGAQKVLNRRGINVNELPNLENPSCPSPVKVIQINADGNVLREDGEIDSINKISEFKDNSICIFFNEGYNSSLFRSLLSTRNLSLCDIGEVGNADNKTITDNVADLSFPKNRFLLFGEIKDAKLLYLIKKHYREHPDFQILAIKVISENQVLMFEGDLDIVREWLVNRPIAMSVLEKKDCWRVSQTVEILNIDEFFLDMPIQIFPLTSRLSGDRLSEIKDRMVLGVELDETEVVELIHYAYRFRGLSNNILSVKDIGPKKVEITVGSSNSGSGIKFKKVKNRWQIYDYYEYRR